MPIKLLSKQKPVNPVIELCCDLCKATCSRRKALTVEVNGRSLFLCEPCCRETGSGAYSDPYGWNDFWLVRRGGAA